VIQEILGEGTRVTGVEVFAGLAELDRLRAQVRALLADSDFLLVPSTPTIYTVDEINQRPRELNARLGLYTNFVNLQQLCALAVPNGFRADGLPSGVTLIGLPEQDARLAAFGAAYQHALGGPLGATGPTPPAPAAAAATASGATANSHRQTHSQYDIRQRAGARRTAVAVVGRTWRVNRSTTS
jgi:allophanate hydrolase